LFSIEVLSDLHAHMEWADAAVWAVVPETTSPTPDPRLRDLLAHFHFTQQSFLALWTGQQQPGLDAVRFATLAELRAWAHPYYQRALTFLRGRSAADLATPCLVPWARLFERQVGRPPCIPTVGETFFQVTSHTTYHRAQVNTRLRELGVAPPLVDYIGWLWQGRPAATWPDA
jgi:uncharacterized damage-inducible protein DinB